MKENVVQTKTYDFALRVVQCCRHLKKDRNEHVLSKQLLRSGTSIGANVEEAIGAQSRRDFIAKLSISYKEARETHYWLRLLGDAGIMEKNLNQSMLTNCEEVLRIIGSILKTTKASG